MRRFVIATLGPLLAAFLLSGCALFGSNAETDAQKFYALQGDYKGLLQTLVAYRDGCEAKPVDLRLDCDVYVAEAQKIMAIDVQPAYATARDAVASGVSIEMAAANAGLRSAIAHLTQYLLAHQIQNGEST